MKSTWTLTSIQLPSKKTDGWCKRSDWSSNWILRILWCLREELPWARAGVLSSPIGGYWPCLGQKISWIHRWTGEKSGGQTEKSFASVYPRTVFSFTFEKIPWGRFRRGSVSLDWKQVLRQRPTNHWDHLSFPRIKTNGLYPPENLDWNWQSIASWAFHHQRN